MRLIVGFTHQVDVGKNLQSCQSMTWVVKIYLHFAADGQVGAFTQRELKIRALRPFSGPTDKGKTVGSDAGTRYGSEPHLQEIGRSPDTPSAN